ncbi:MAG: hypothetical protein ACI8Z1_003817, partial [Candidatus Azotimanducaceae bacterium]
PKQSWDPLIDIYLRGPTCAARPARPDLNILLFKASLVLRII